jgi:hypothetical protein
MKVISLLLISISVIFSNANVPYLRGSYEQSPTGLPTVPSKAPSKAPSNAPSNAPSVVLSTMPLNAPSVAPSFAPSNAPSTAPSTRNPTGHPTIMPLNPIIDNSNLIPIRTIIIFACIYLPISLIIGIYMIYHLCNSNKK